MNKRKTVRLGLGYTSPSGLTLTSNAFYDGLGTRRHTLGLTLGVKVAF